MFSDVGTGVATVNQTGGGTHLNTLRLAGGITVSGTVPVTDPEVTASIVSVIVQSADLGSGTFGSISGPGPISPNQLPIGGIAKVCLVFVGCTSFLPLSLSQGPNTGQGVGGLATIGQLGQIRISIIQAPWQLSASTLITHTANGAFQTVMRTGFVHGPESNTSTTAAPSGVIQLISPQQVVTSGIPTNSDKIALFNTLTIHFIPEPGLLLLIGSGALGLALLGGRRRGMSRRVRADETSCRDSGRPPD